MHEHSHTPTPCTLLYTAPPDQCQHRAQSLGQRFVPDITVINLVNSAGVNYCLPQHHASVVTSCGLQLPSMRTDSPPREKMMKGVLGHQLRTDVSAHLPTHIALHACFNRSIAACAVFLGKLIAFGT